jgi:two-component system osmolarity sensor histidine kinase EnvZ
MTMPKLKSFLPRTLFGRALLIIVVPVVVLEVIATVVFYERHWDTVTRRLAIGLAGDISHTVESLRATPDPVAREAIFAAAERHMALDMTFLPGEILPNSPPRFSVSNRIVDRTLHEAMASSVFRPFRIDTLSYPEDIEIRVQLPEGVLQVLTTRKRVSSSTTYLFILWMVGTSLVLFAIAILMLRNQIRPIRKLAQAAESFGKGRDVADFKPRGAAEVRQAATAFLRMHDRIRRQIAQRTEMLAGVSHDLRTPLTRMKLQLALLPESDEVAYLKDDVAEMERMVEGYLAFMRGQDAEAVEQVDIVAMLDRVIADGRRQGTRVDRRDPEAVDGPLPVSLRPDAFRRCLANLIDNAARFSSRVEVGLRRNGDHIEVTVDDDGPGIPPDKREDVFRPFLRLEGSRNPATGGLGLGLAIVRDVVHSHGGEITLEDAPIGGLRALVRLPL